MSLATIENLLRQRMGLDPSSIGSSAIERAVDSRMEACHLTELGDYVVRVQSSEDEWEELLDAVVVPETWFFRDRASYGFLSEYVLSQWLPRNPHSALRVLSLPCATGEEPYSIAMCLVESGLPPSRLLIDAADISRESLQKASRAFYGENSFRGEDLSFRDHYFDKNSDGYQLREQIQSLVNFLRGNLLDGITSKGHQPYDVVFCRNLLIYFDAQSRERAVRILHDLLTPEGLLFSGYAEAEPILAPCFQSVRVPRAFAFRKAACREEQPKADRSRDLNRTKSKRTQPAVGASDQGPLPRSRRKRSSPHGAMVPETKDRPPKVTEGALEIAQHFADRGFLSEASTLCELYLHQHADNAQAYYLMGLIRQASGRDTEAEQCFSRAVYLEPHHQEALLHLALLADQQGETDRGKNLRQRAKRAQTTQMPNPFE